MHGSSTPCTTAHTSKNYSSPADKAHGCTATTQTQKLHSPYEKKAVPANVLPLINSNTPATICANPPYAIA